MLIEIDRLRLCLGGAVILHDVRLSLGEGEIYGLLGPNGAGKSTTIAAALGLLAPEAGTVRVFGRDPRREASAVRARLGVLPEQGGFYDWMTGERYLAFFAKLYDRSLSPSELRDRLARVGLAPRPGQAIGSYSRGMRQRLGLARALLVEPPLLILDEPTGGLDPRGRRDIHDLLLGLAERGVGILLSTHLLDDVDRLCRRIGIVVEGRTVAEGNVADLLWAEGRGRRYRLRLASEPPPAEAGHVAIVARDGEWWTVDIDPARPPDAAWRELIAGGWRILEIQRAGGGLEDLYLALTERRAAA